MDERVSKSERGGAGKSLLVRILTLLRKVVTIDAGKKDRQDNFLFDPVRPDTDIVLFDDMKERYPLQELNAIITADFEVNVKYGAKFTLPFKVSPKLVGTSNYMIDTTAPGVKRRTLIIEINDHFSYEHTPMDEFKHRFFEDWSEEQKNTEINFLIRCVQFYLQNGIVKSELTDAENKLLNHKVGEDFKEAFDAIIPTLTIASNKQIREQVYQYLDWAEPTTRSEQTAYSFKLKDYLRIRGIAYKKITIPGTKKKGIDFTGNTFDTP
jgi:hypothetical protein